MRRASAALAVIAAAAVMASTAPNVSANVGLKQVSRDRFTNSSSQHRTELEPDTFSSGATEVAAFQSGRFTDGGASDIGWATTTNGGATWTHGFLPGTTTFVGGTYARISDPAVAFDPKHGVWMISGLAINSSVVGAAVLVSRSTNGGTVWNKPVTVTRPGGSAFLDKEWIGCDGNAASPYYGNCYTEWDDNGNLNLVYMSMSADGGLTWSTPVNTADMFHGIGGQPVTLPNGNVVVPIDNLNGSSLEAFISTDGGVTWTAPVVIAAVRNHTAGGNLRNGSLPSAVVDSGGTVYVAWESCVLEPRCAANDILVSTSTTGLAWTPPVKAAGDGTTDFLLPGLGVDHATSGSTAHLGIDLYSEPASCSSNCSLNVDFVSSTTGGAAWTATPLQLAGPINTTWLADTTQGRMVGDYNSTSFLAGKAYPVFAVAKAPVGGTFSESMDAPSSGLGVLLGPTRATSAAGVAAPTTAAGPPLLAQ